MFRVCIQGTSGIHLFNSCFLLLTTLMCIVYTRGRMWLFSISHLGLHVTMNTSTVPNGPRQTALSLSKHSPCVMYCCSYWTVTHNQIALYPLSLKLPSTTPAWINLKFSTSSSFGNLPGSQVSLSLWYQCTLWPSLPIWFSELIQWMIQWIQWMIQWIQWFYSLNISWIFYIL